MVECAAVVVARDGRLPGGADEAVSEAGGAAVVVGTGAGDAIAALTAASHVWWAETPTGPATLAAMLAPVVADIPVLILPASPDGRDLAPRLAAATGRPLAPGAVSVRRQGVDLLRVDGQVAVEITFSGPVVATLMPGARSVEARSTPPVIAALRVTGSTGERAEAEVVALVPPDPATMDLADARLVLGGGAGLVPPGTPVDQAGAVFDLLTEVAAAMGASAGATRVVTDAGWMRYDRQIGTTGVAVDPDLYVALGVSGASQHTGGLGAPRHIVSVNTDPSCPMTAMADLGLVADGLSVLVELARHLDVVVPAELEEAVR